MKKDTLEVDLDVVLVEQAAGNIDNFSQISQIALPPIETVLINRHWRNAVVWVSTVPKRRFHTVPDTYNFRKKIIGKFCQIF